MSVVNMKKIKKNDIVHQWSSIDNLRKNNTTLKDEIETEIRLGTITDIQETSKINELQSQGTKLARENELSLKKMNSLKDEIKEISKILYERKKLLNSSDGAEIPHLKKRMKMLEHKLEKTRQKHNESLAEIQTLKEHVNASRRERVIFDNVFKNLETDLKLKEEEFKKYLFDNLQIEKERLIAEEELEKIKFEAEKEIQYFSKEYANAFKNNNQSSENLLVKDNLDLALEAEKSSRKGSEKKSIYSPKRSISSHKKKLSVDAAPLENTKKYLDLYDLISEKLKYEADVKDIDEFIEVFKNQEAINSEMFEKSNELNDRIETLEKEINLVNKEIKLYGEEIISDEINTQTSREEVIQLKKDVKIAETEKIKLDENNKKIIDDLAFLISQLPQCLEAINCKSENNNEEIDYQNISIWNLNSYLSLFEKKANKIVDLSKIIENKDFALRSFLKKSPSPNRTRNGKKEDKDSEMIDLLEGVEKIKESEKIMTSVEFEDKSLKEIAKFKNKSQNKKKNQNSNRIL